MKTIYTLLILFIFAQNQAHSQTHWAQPGAKWYYSCNDPLAFGYQRFERLNDTLFNGIVCQQIHKNFSLLVWGIPQFGQEDYYCYLSNDTAYTWNDSNFVIHAIYNAQIGDTWPMTNRAAPCASGVGYFQVDSIGNVVICNDTLTRWFLTAYFPNYQTSGFFTVPTYLTEKLGYDFAMFPFYTCAVDVSICSTMRCYSDSAGCSYSTGIVPYCNAVTAIEQNNKESAISISPNPVSSTFTITNNMAAFDALTVELTDVTGKSVLKQSLLENESTLSITQIPNGIYFVTIAEQGKSLFKSKLIVNH